jgi:hypothetical protein
MASTPPSKSTPTWYVAPAPVHTYPSFPVLTEASWSQVHVFQAFGSLAAKSREALNSAVAFIHSHIGRPSTTIASTSFVVTLAAL